MKAEIINFYVLVKLIYFIVPSLFYIQNDEDAR
jgi:hypothetical protein